MRRRLPCVLAILVVVLPTVGSLSKARFHPVNAGKSEDWGPQELRFLSKEGFRCLGSGALACAARVAERGSNRALALGETQSAVYFRSMLGACRFKMLQYREALKAYLEALRLAESIGMREEAAALAVNCSSLYHELQDSDAAERAAEQGLAEARGLVAPRYRAELLGQLGRTRAHLDPDGSAALLREAIPIAEQEGKTSLEATLIDELGMGLLARGDRRGAERALVDSLHLRLMTRDPDLFLSYWRLAVLRQAQGDLAAASNLIDHALVAAAKAHRPMKWYLLYHRRGEIRKSRGRLKEALDDLRNALALAERWRLEILPADSFRSSTDVGLQEIYESAVRTAADLYFRSGRKELAAESFQALEQNRAASLREGLAAGREWRRRIDPAYLEILTQLRAVEASGTGTNDRRVQNLQWQLTEMEMRAGLNFTRGVNGGENFRTQKSLIHFRRGLRESEAFLSFHLGPSGSYVWAVTRHRLTLRRVPGRETLAADAAHFRRAVESGSPEAASLGERLYRELFAGLDPEIYQKPEWLLSLDDVLFEVPFGALVSGRRNGTPVYLIETHSTQILPSALMLDNQPAQSWSRRFVGVGDPIYNLADSRLRQPYGGVFRLVSSTAQPPLQLSRLVGSGREAATCARIWGDSGASTVLTGAQASREHFQSSLAESPAIIHLATHVLVPAADHEPFVALSLRPSGEADVLTTADISTLHVPGALVSLSGCNSAAGATLPGAGLLGLTRAWLMAGAGAVLASQWATPDDTGQFFFSFYTQLRDRVRRGDSRSAAANALRDAQLEMIRSASWRAAPQYWAAYVLTGGNR